MKTVYFPYTHIDPQRAERMAALWGLLTLLQPSADTCLPDMASLQAAGIIETIFPASGGRTALKDVLQDMKQWAAQHTGGDLALMMEQRQAIPFFNSQSSAQIVADIRKGGKSPVDDPAADFRDNVFQAQLILAMAQELDLQQAALTRDIEALSVKENEMMALLKGEDFVDMDPMVSSWASRAVGSDPGRVVQRLNAWARVMAAVDGMDLLAGDAAEILFVTDDRGVLSQIQEMFPEAETRLWSHHLAPERTSSHDIEHLPSWLAGPLSVDRGEESDEDGGISPGFDLVEIPRMSAEAFLLRLSDPTHREVSGGSSRSSAGSCWIGCMTQAGDDHGESIPVS